MVVCPCLLNKQNKNKGTLINMAMTLKVIKDYHSEYKINVLLLRF